MENVKKSFNRKHIIIGISTIIIGIIVYSVVLYNTGKIESYVNIILPITCLLWIINGIKTLEKTKKIAIIELVVWSIILMFWLSKLIT